MQVNKVLFLAFSLNAEVQEDETMLIELSASTWTVYGCECCGVQIKGQGSTAWKGTWTQGVWCFILSLEIFDMQCVFQHVL